MIFHTSIYRTEQYEALCIVYMTFWLLVLIEIVLFEKTNLRKQ